MKYYGSISIKDNDPTRYVFTGPNNSMFKRPKYIFTEAAEYRKVFAAMTESRLRWNEIDLDQNDPTFEIFSESSPRQLLLNLLMMDFYNAVPTGFACLESKIGHRNAVQISRQAIKSKLMVKEPDPTDRRRKMLFPTVYLVQKYEQKTAKTVFRTAARVGKLKDSTVVPILVEYDKLRQQYLPFEISKQVTFDLTAEFLKLGNTTSSGNLYLKNVT
tara:strand:- start:1226 stop:1873 length:648 start_codon:yes stop_codon:yes gene_type:complete